MNYEQMALLYKVMADKNRLEIIDILSCGPLCACDILEHFNVSQPTLSHHMKQLKSANIVESWKDGTKVMYRLNDETARYIKSMINQLFTENERCPCHSIKGDCCS